MATDRPRQGGNNNQAAGTTGRNSMFLALMLTIGLMVYEIIGGWASDSLALLAAAGRCRPVAGHWLRNHHRWVQCLGRESARVG